MAEDEDNVETGAPEEPAPSDASESSTPEEAAAPAVEDSTASDVADASGPESDAPQAPAEALTPTERRRQKRSAKAAAVPARPQRSAPERQEERMAERRRKAEVRRRTRQRARAKAASREHDTEATPPREHQPGVQKVRQGVVVSDAPDKTISVRIDVARRHRQYKKIVRTSSTLHVHDERNDAHVGDTVIVRECRPLSRTKSWRLVEVVERAK